MSRGSGKGLSLKDKLDGNELDLSLCDLNEVPVRELVFKGVRFCGPDSRYSLLSRDKNLFGPRDGSGDDVTSVQPREMDILMREKPQRPKQN